MTGTLLWVGGFLFLGEWLFGSIGWGLAHGLLFGIGLIVALGLAGLACSAFLPLSISFGGKEFPRLSAMVAGELIAFYRTPIGRKLVEPDRPP